MSRDPSSLSAFYDHLLGDSEHCVSGGSNQSLSTSVNSSKAYTASNPLTQGDNLYDHLQTLPSCYASYFFDPQPEYYVLGGKYS